MSIISSLSLLNSSKRQDVTSYLRYVDLMNGSIVPAFELVEQRSTKRGLMIFVKIWRGLVGPVMVFVYRIVRIGFTLQTTGVLNSYADRFIIMSHGEHSLRRSWQSEVFSFQDPSCTSRSLTKTLKSNAAEFLGWHTCFVIFQTHFPLVGGLFGKRTYFFTLGRRLRLITARRMYSRVFCFCF